MHHSTIEMASFDQCSKALDYIRTKTSISPKIGIVCGSGLGGIGDLVVDPIQFPYKEIPGFHESSVSGHKSRLLVGKLAGIDVVLMQGRFHGYEGIPYSQCAFPIRVMKLMGIEKLIVTNAAGGLNKNFKLGDFMVLNDHLPVAMWSGNNPLVGNNEEKFGPRFPAMSDAYDRELKKLVLETAKEIGQESTTQTGTYIMMPGPTYETIAELRMFSSFGDAVGMSTAPEVVVARHCGIRCMGISMITNICVLDYDSQEAANHEEVIETAAARGKDMEALVTALVPKL